VAVRQWRRHTQPRADQINLRTDVAKPMLTAIEPPALAEMTACRRCCYLMVGGPPVGRCPECGAEYDRGEMVLFGRSRRAPWLRWGLAAVAASVLALTVLNVIQFGRHRFDLPGILVCSSILSGTLWAEVKRRWTGRVHTVRVWLSRAGCGSDEEPESALHVRLLTLLLYGTRRPADERAWHPAGTLRWSAVRRLRVTPAGDDRWRLRFVRRRARWRRTPIDVIVVAPPEQVDALRTFAARFTKVVRA
jgi:hypothetical protein